MVVSLQFLLQFHGIVLQKVAKVSTANNLSFLRQIEAPRKNSYTTLAFNSQNDNAITNKKITLLIMYLSSRSYIDFSNCSKVMGSHEKLF